MKIEFGVQEYFNELKLMDAQYGQEEELYPSVQYISMSYSKVGRGGCSESCKENFNLAASAKYSGE